MRKLVFTIVIFLTTLTSFGQDFYVLRGFVTDQNADPLIGVTIRVQNTTQGTTTNEKGQYELQLPDGMNRLVFSYIGYKTQVLDQLMTHNSSLNIVLEEDENQLKAVEVRNRKKDLSYEIVRKAIENKDRYLDNYSSQKVNVYVKSVEENENVKLNKKEQEEFDNNPFRNDSVPNLNLFEATFIQHSAPPNKWKEEKLAAKKLNDQTNLFFTSTTDANIRFEENLIKCKKLGDNAFISPISSAAFAAYKYRLLGSHFEGNQKIYTVKVIPRKMGNALFSGTMEILDSLYVIKSVSLELPKNALIVYDYFRIKQEYDFSDGRRTLSEQQFQWKTKTGRSNANGTCVVKYSDYVFDSTYSKKFFNAEVGTTAEDAYEKDTGFWSSIRPIPLTNDEYVFIKYQDSIERIMTSQWYLDSIDSVYNKITIGEVLWEGVGFIDREKKVNWEFDPVISVIDPVAIGGWRVRYSVNYYKKFEESRRSINVSPFLNYGFRNQDLKGNLSLRYLYNPRKLSTISLNTGRYFGFVNQFATINDIIRRSNFFEQTHTYLYHRTELFNGFYITNGLQELWRNDLGDFQFAAIGDSLYENNFPAVFDAHTAFEVVVALNYTPKQLYIQEPKEKIVLGSRYPTFGLLYRQGVPNFFGSSTSYKYGEASVSQVFNVGIIGTSQYSATIGGFLDTTNLKIMDYRYQRGGDRFLFLPPMFGFQQIDSTFAVFKPFFEGHYVHQFNGFLTSKIPGIKQLGIKTMAGGGLLVVPERSYQYSELFGGVNRIIKIGKERLRLGVYYVVSQSNTQGFTTGFKFSFEPYNRDKNTWSF